MNYLITIIGPTAIGKTSLSIALAQHYKCEILSCDSRQFFKEMTIGTAVPSQEELMSVQHHFIQNKSIFEKYTVGDFEKEALSKLDELFTNQNIQIMVGGSGLYVEAVLKGFDEFPEIDSSLRNKINADFELFGINYLQQIFEKYDPTYYAKIAVENPQTLQNPQRLKRFVEVCLGTGTPYSSFLHHQSKERNFTPIIIGLEAERSIMYQRMNQRVEAMIAQGLEEEARALLLNKDLNGLQTVGYRELFEYFEGKMSFEMAIEEIKKNTRRFAKRQLTWFKRTENVTWFDYEIGLQTIINHVESKIK